MCETAEGLYARLPKAHHSILRVEHEPAKEDTDTAHLADAIANRLGRGGRVMAIRLQVLLCIVHADHGAPRDLVGVSPRLVPLDGMLGRACDAEALQRGQPQTALSTRTSAQTILAHTRHS